MLRFAFPNDYFQSDPRFGAEMYGRRDASQELPILTEAEYLAKFQNEFWSDYVRCYQEAWQNNHRLSKSK